MLWLDCHLINITHLATLVTFMDWPQWAQAKGRLADSYGDDRGGRAAPPGGPRQAQDGMWSTMRRLAGNDWLQWWCWFIAICWWWSSAGKEHTASWSPAGWRPLPGSGEGLGLTIGLRTPIGRRKIHDALKIYETVLTVFIPKKGAFTKFVFEFIIQKGWGTDVAEAD